MKTPSVPHLLPSTHALHLRKIVLAYLLVKMAGILEEARSLPSGWLQRRADRSTMLPQCFSMMTSPCGIGIGECSDKVRSKFSYHSSPEQLFRTDCSSMKRL